MGILLCIPAVSGYKCQKSGYKCKKSQQNSLCGSNFFEVSFLCNYKADDSKTVAIPGFVMDCSIQRNRAVLNIPYSGDFHVRDVDYLKQEIQLYDPNDCLPWRLMDFNLSSSPFMADYYRNYTFLSCPSDYTISQITTINCLSNSTVSVLATSSMNLARAMNMCSVIVTLPIPVSLPFQNQGFSSDLNDDLKLTWNIPDCIDCEVKGGTCGFENSSSRVIQCFSDPGTGNQFQFSSNFMIFALKNFRSFFKHLLVCKNV